jgi:primase-polymerase (primpol)-like protein
MNIPKELLEYDNWIVWRSQERGGKLTKIPYTLKGELADTTDRTTWGSYDEAIKALEKGNYEGLGFVFTDSPFAGVDLDHVLNGDELDTEAAEIVAVLNSYTERSPGGDGLHVLVKGTLPEGRRRKGNVEMYDTGRYFTMTGEHWAGTPKAVEDRQSQLRMVHKALLSDNGKTAREPRPAPLSPASLDDRDLLEKAMNAKNGTKFASLWNGDTSGYKSHSEADLALASMLAFWAGNDAARIERLFSQSGLGQRDKWRERADYRTRTIAKAVESGECYDPNSHNVPQSVSEALEHREDGKSGDSKPQKDTEGGDPGKLLEKAAAIDDPIERAKAMKAFLRSLVGFSETMQDAWLERAKEKTGFGKTVLTHDLKRVQQEDEGKEPGQRELHERWLKSYPHTVRTVYWRRYEGGWWPVIPEDEVKSVLNNLSMHGH